MRFLYLLSLLIFSCNVSAQNEVSTLYFGTTLLDFRHQPPLVLSNQAKESLECAASICDPQGNLLFYSNGGVSPTATQYQGGVFSPNHSYLQNGNFTDSGGCVSSFQGAIALPDPEGITPTNRKYYLFTKDCLESTFSGNQYNSGLTYSIIDMNANSGQGAVISRYNVLVPYHIISGHKSNYEPVTAVLDSDGEAKKSGEAGYWLFSYTDDSLYHIHFGVGGFNQFQKLVGGEGALVVSPNRRFMTVGNALYDLDPVLGTVQFRAALGSSVQAAFSPDGTKLYLISGTTLKQYDLEQANVLATVQNIASVNTNSKIILAPSKRILIYQESVSFIDGEIVCPNNLGVACGLDPANISLGGGISPSSEKPNIPAHYLYGTTTNCHLGIEQEQENSFSVFPNPSNGNFVVQLNATSTNKLTLSIVDLAGRIVRTEQISELSEKNQIEVHVSNLQKGNYFLVLDSEEGLPVTKVFLIE
ncbi:T9SS type A sorting domain-containing protein [Fluviicola taffensis]|uniref:Secretion system C-terminal sorting domain-containing protein n=1 Tax=Fluviicola taffensis (strain DSM 16823 / NCIMB 13979 / RW262) TaxID=755732 RepID=F2IGZ9_FLUTR|nr:T9SS type A sorting domain-containing protein [Fluviicola taffensis]AEA44780.1 hypothetical protein Fluta_2800 [Fluviicola taffensis DSM 16823]